MDLITLLQKAIRKDSKGQERFEDYFSDSEEEQTSKNNKSADAAPADKTTEEPTEDESMEVDEGAKPADEPKEPEKEKEEESKKAPEEEYEEWKKKSLKKGEKEVEKSKEKEDSNSAPKEKEQPKIITAKKSAAAVTVTMAATEEDEGETMEDIENFISKDATADAEESPTKKVMYGQVTS